MLDLISICIGFPLWQQYINKDIYYLRHSSAYPLFGTFPGTPNSNLVNLFLLQSLFFLAPKNPGSTTGSGKSHRLPPHHTFAQLSGPNPPVYHVHHFHHTVAQPQNSNSTQVCSSRRRESANSSIGATSVRRLLTVNRGCRHKIPVHVRANVIKNFMFLVIGHGLISATLLPLMGLQVKVRTRLLLAITELELISHSRDPTRFGSMCTGRPSTQSS